MDQHDNVKVCNDFRFKKIKKFQSNFSYTRKS